MHRLAVDVKKGLSFARDLSTKNSFFDPISINIKEVRSIKPSANVFVFGDFNAHSKYRVTCCGGTDRTG